MLYFATILSSTNASGAGTFDLIDDPPNALGVRTFAVSPITSANGENGIPLAAHAGASAALLPRSAKAFTTTA